MIIEKEVYRVLGEFERQCPEEVYVVSDDFVVGKVVFETDDLIDIEIRQQIIERHSRPNVLKHDVESL